MVYISPLPASALSLAVVDADAIGWGALAAAASGASLAGLAAVAATDVQRRAPHVEVTNVHVGWGAGTQDDDRKCAKDIVAGVRRGAKRLVLGHTERGLDIWSRMLPGRPAVSSDDAGLAG